MAVSDQLEIDWAPTPERVAALLNQYTRDSQDHSGESGTLVDEPTYTGFSDTTSPPLAVVNELIGQACDEMAGLLEGHPPCNASLTLGVASATAYLAAALVVRARDTGYAANEGSPYQTLYAQWLQRGPAIASIVQGSCPFVPDPDAALPDTSSRLGPVAVLPNNPGRMGWDTPL